MIRIKQGLRLSEIVLLKIKLFVVHL